MTAHCVASLELELSVSDQEQARHLTETTSRLFEPRLVPLLERVCSELSPAEQLQRIEKLELTLPRLSSDDYEQQLLQALEEVLRDALAGIVVQPASAMMPTPIELLHFFAQSGNLPWWADPAGPDPIAAAWRHALADHAPELTRLLADLAGDSTWLTRLARHIDATGLAALADRAHSQAAVAVLRLLRAHAAEVWNLSKPTPLVVRARVAVLEAVASDSGGGDAALALQIWERLLVELELLAGSSRSGVFGSVAATAGVDAEPPRSPRSPKPPRVAHRARSEPSRTRELEVPLALAPAKPLAEASLNPSEASVNSGEVRTEPAEPEETPERREQQTPTNTAGRPSITSSVSASLSLRAGAATEAPDGGSRPRAEPSSVAQLHAPSKPAPPRAPKVNAAASEQLEPLRVLDAGLVILSPFLARLFQVAELTDESGLFVCESARARAVTLLSYLTFEDDDPPEYLTALPKVLCGLPPDGALPPLEPLPEVLQQECARLLEATLAHARLSDKLTPAAFRGMFLRRTGSLGTQDGSWLLRVERHPQDVVLERFPWSWVWLKLPFMTSLLKVEW